MNQIWCIQRPVRSRWNFQLSRVRLSTQSWSSSSLQIYSCAAREPKRRRRFEDCYGRPGVKVLPALSWLQTAVSSVLVYLLNAVSKKFQGPNLWDPKKAQKTPLLRTLLYCLLLVLKRSGKNCSFFEWRVKTKPFLINNGHLLKVRLEKKIL